MLKIFVITLFVLNGISHAADISGVVTVLEKDGQQPLQSFTNAVVFVDGIETPPPAEPVVLDQRDKKFIPRLLPVIKGQEIRVYNSDAVQHNVFSPHEREPFDLGTFSTDEYRILRLYVMKRHPVYCNIHKNMIADIYVLPGKYFTVTDAEGRYRIRNVPPGDHILKVWHIFGGADEKNIRVGAANDQVTVDFVIQNTKVIREIGQHKNKFGQEYRQTDDSNYAF